MNSEASASSTDDRNDAAAGGDSDSGKDITSDASFDSGCLPDAGSCNSGACRKSDKNVIDLDEDGTPDSPSWCDGFYQCTCRGNCEYYPPDPDTKTVCPRPDGKQYFVKCCEGDYPHNPNGSGYCVDKNTICIEPDTCANMGGICRADTEDAGCLDTEYEENLRGCSTDEICCVSMEAGPVKKYTEGS